VRARLVAVSAAVLGLILPARPVFADPPLAGLLIQLLAQEIRMNHGSNPAPGTPNPDHTDHYFIPAVGQVTAAFELNKALVSQLSTFPIGSSSGGFTYSFDSKSRAFSRSSESFGPAFAERGLTNGKGRFSAGFNFQHTSYSEFEGTSLDNGQINFNLRHNDCCAKLGDALNPPFEGDLVQLQLSLKASSSTTAMFVNYGLTNRLDVGVTVPVVSVSLDAFVVSTIDSLSKSAPTIHSWDGKGSTVETSNTGTQTATGVGDILVRAKYNFWRNEAGAVAAGLDVRLPTGDSKNLLGTGATQTRIQLIGSGAFGFLAPHVNIGYTFSNGNMDSAVADLGVENATYNTNVSVPSEANYTFGTEIIPHPRLTLAVDFVGRSLRDVPRFAIQNQPFEYHLASAPTAPPLSTTLSGLDFADLNHPNGTLNLALGVVSGKYNIPNTTLLITGSVLFPLNDNGLKPGVTGVVGLDYGFGH